MNLQRTGGKGIDRGVFLHAVVASRLKIATKRDWKNRSLGEKSTCLPISFVNPISNLRPTAPEPAATHDASGKYIPPSLRGKGLGGPVPVGETMGGRGGDRRDDLSTIRITNLSEDTTEQDVKDLVSRFGHTSRVVGVI